MKTLIGVIGTALAMATAGEIRKIEAQPARRGQQLSRIG